jgi:hypothetical protein
MGCGEAAVRPRGAMTSSRDFEGDSNRSVVLDEAPQDLLAHPKAGVRSEAVTAGRVELVARAHQANRRFLHHIRHVDGSAAKAARAADGHVEVCRHELRLVAIRPRKSSSSDGGGWVPDGDRIRNAVEHSAMKAYLDEVFLE